MIHANLANQLIVGLLPRKDRGKHMQCPSLFSGWKCCGSCMWTFGAPGAAPGCGAAPQKCAPWRPASIRKYHQTTLFLLPDPPPCGGPPKICAGASFPGAKCLTNSAVSGAGMPG